jgi:hypothetical protein
MRLKQKSYHYVNPSNANQQSIQRDVVMYGSDFKSGLPQQPQTIKDKRYGTSYNQFFGKNNEDALTKTQSEFMRTRQGAGNYHPVT